MLFTLNKFGPYENIKLPNINLRHLSGEFTIIYKDANNFDFL